MGELNLATIQELLSQQTAEIKRHTSDSLKTYEKAVQKLEILEKRCIQIERKLRRNNIILFGLTLDGSDLVNQTIVKLNQLFNLNITTSDLNNIYRIGKGSSSPIVVEFTSFLKKREIFKSPEKLKALKGTGVSVANDLCKEDREEQKILRRHLSEAKRRNEDARIIGHKLEINKIAYTVSELEATDTEYEAENNSDNEAVNDHNNETETDNHRAGGSQKYLTLEGSKKGKFHTPSPAKHTRNKKKGKR